MVQPDFIIPIEDGALEPSSVNRWQLRLVISIPALMVLFTLAYGVVSYQLFKWHWTELELAGAQETAEVLIRGHYYAMITLSLLAACMGVGLAFTILHPIREINETAKMIARGRFDSRVRPLSTAPELGSLSASFNSMIEFVNNIIQERDRFLREGMMAGMLTTTSIVEMRKITPLMKRIYS